MTTTHFNKRKLIIPSIILILAVGMIGCAGPQGHSGRHGSRQGQPPSKEQLFNEFDRNNDGKLSKEEFPGPDDHFIQFDQNSDGYLEKDEMPDGPPSRKNRG